ncbi:MAG TPA: cytochrome P450, partial [Alcanivorax sp.]|nr:cytochrome P450 [Alcanivorax sp.]
EWQDTLAEEMDQVAAAAEHPDRLGYGDLEKMTKTGWVFRETLRLRPALTAFPRRT